MTTTTETKTTTTKRTTRPSDRRPSKATPQQAKEVLDASADAIETSSTLPRAKDASSTDVKSRRDKAIELYGQLVAKHNRDELISIEELDKLAGLVEFLHELLLGEVDKRLRDVVAELHVYVDEKVEEGKEYTDQQVQQLRKEQRNQTIVTPTIATIAFFVIGTLVMAFFLIGQAHPWVAVLWGVVAGAIAALVAVAIGAAVERLQSTHHSISNNPADVGISAPTEPYPPALPTSRKEG